MVSGILSEAFRELAQRSTDSSYYTDQANYHQRIWDNGMADLKPKERKIKSNRVYVSL